MCNSPEDTVDYWEKLIQFVCDLGVRVFASAGMRIQDFFVFFLTLIYYYTKYMISGVQPHGYGLKQGQELSKCAITKEIHGRVCAVLSCLWCDYVSLDDFPQFDFVESECLDELG